MEPEKYTIIDPALVPVYHMINMFSQHMDGVMTDENDIQQMSIEKIILDIPIEVDVYSSTEQDTIIGISTPTQKLETSFMPIFHQMKIVLEKHEPQELEIQQNHIPEKTIETIEYDSITHGE